MVTWEETCQHLRQRFKLAIEEPTWIGLVWRFADAGDQPERQRVELVDAFGRPFLLILSDAGPEGAGSYRDALLRNMKMTIGAVALEPSGFVVRHLMPLDEVTWPGLDLAIEVVAREASMLRGRSAAPLGCDNLFRAYSM